MATQTKKVQQDHDSLLRKYASCVVTPMTNNGDGKPMVEKVHVVDATIVGGIVFFSLLLGASLPDLILGRGVYVTAAEVKSRALTALIGFCLTFLAQWARYRGIQMIQLYTGQQEGDDK